MDEAEEEEDPAGGIVVVEVIVVGGADEALVVDVSVLAPVVVTPPFSLPLPLDPPTLKM